MRQDFTLHRVQSGHQHLCIANTAVPWEQLRLFRTIYSLQKGTQMWDLSTKVLLKLHRAMGMPGRKGEKDQYILPPPFCNGEGMLVMKPLASVVRIMIAQHCDMPAPLLKVVLSSSQSVFDEFLFGTYTWHVHYCSLFVHNLEQSILDRTW